MQKYLIAVGLGEDRQHHLRERVRRAGLAIVLDRPGLLTAGNAPSKTIPIGQSGCIFGSLFAQGSAKRVLSLPGTEAEQILVSGGRHLIDQYWGDYVALIPLAGSVAILRSPFGTLPCLYRAPDRHAHLASDIDTLQLGTEQSWSIDYDAVARQLVFADMRLRETCLEDVREVRGGERVRFLGGRAEHRILWSPWHFVHAGRVLPGPEEAAARLREQAIRCVQAKTRDADRCLVMLSGGLDSSIVAAALTANGRGVACLNLVAPASAGDERIYARAACERLKLALAERRMNEGSLLLELPATTSLPRPVARSFEQMLYRTAGDIAEELGCDTIVDGGGGDNVFCSLQSASPAADCLLDRQGPRAFRQTCNEIAALTHASAWRVARKAARRAWERSRPYRWPTAEQMLSPEAVAAAHRSPLHPWLLAGIPPRPGRSAQIAQLIGAQSFMEDGPHGAKWNVVSPLVSQPLIEHCLSLAPWQWIERGCNRAIARRAFSDMLPPEVIWRRSKGIPDSYIVQLYETNREMIRDRLLGGLLAAAGVIDIAAVEAALDDPTPFRGRECSRIVRLMDAEIWARGIRDSSRFLPSAPCAQAPASERTAPVSQAPDLHDPAARS
ncbi:asparagine synthetase B family protein [Novosphingobium sp. TCA1]|uniref:asparagine synthase-related protein n=1 Tax=Novosphingobium sp. TCA1 TaxID=2682474 RepID=UPI00130C7D27|nr:asparagine synthetase B family protein [Novosphingobium sp. TCA1]GFE76305.1 asparagine synthase [Novosphingobium sp. TCA1]